MTNYNYIYTNAHGLECGGVADGLKELNQVIQRYSGNRLKIKQGNNWVDVNGELGGYYLREYESVKETRKNAILLVLFLIFVTGITSLLIRWSNDPDRGTKHAYVPEYAIPAKSSLDKAKEDHLDRMSRESGVDKEELRKAINDELQRNGLKGWSKGGY